MKSIIRKVVRLIRIAVVAFAAVTLTLSGAASAQRLFSTLEKPEPKPETQSSQLQPGPSPEHQRENVNPPSRPNSEPAAYVSAPVTVESDHNQTRTRHIFCETCPEASYSETSVGNTTLISSAFVVSAFLGVQFTLVGAKPSGTS